MRVLLGGVILICLLVSGCSTAYQDNMKARVQLEEIKSPNKTAAITEIMNIVQHIITPFESEAHKLAKPPVQNTKMQGVHETLIVNQQFNGGNPEVMYALYQLGSIAHKQAEMFARIEISRTRMAVIEYIVPIIQAIYADNQSDFGVPMTPAQVISELVKNVPFLGAIGGMYGLGVEGIRKAGDAITANLQDGSVMQHKNGAPVTEQRSSMYHSLNPGNDYAPIEKHIGGNGDIDRTKVLTEISEPENDRE